MTWEPDLAWLTNQLTTTFPTVRGNLLFAFENNYIHKTVLKMAILSSESGNLFFTIYKWKYQEMWCDSRDKFFFKARHPRRQNNAFLMLRMMMFRMANFRWLYYIEHNGQISIFFYIKKASLDC